MTDWRCSTGGTTNFPSPPSSSSIIVCTCFRVNGEMIARVKNKSATSFVGTSPFAPQWEQIKKSLIQYSLPYYEQECLIGDCSFYNGENQGPRKEGKHQSSLPFFFFAKVVRLPRLQGRFPLFSQVEGLDSLNCLSSDFTNVNYMRKLESGREEGDGERTSE